MDINSKLRTLGIRKQLTLTLFVVSLIGLCVSGATTYFRVSNLVSQLLERDLTNRVQSVLDAIKLNYDGNKSTAQPIIDKIKDRLKSQRILSTGYFFIFNSKGEMVLHPILTGKNILETKDLDGKFIFKEMISDKNGIINYRWLNAETKLPQNKIAIFQYSPEFDWFVAASVNLAEANEPVHELRMIIIGINAIILIFLMICTRWFSISLSDALHDISKSVMRIALQLKESSYKVSQSSQDLSFATTQQSAAMTETASSMEEMASTIAHTAQNSNSVLHYAESSQDETKKSQQVVNQMKDAMNEIHRSNERLISIVKLINEIKDKTKVIHDIVGETRLLSFNASIEAARAGSHGKGFAVVAEEVGKLAQMSGLAAQEIGTLLESGTAEVSKVVKIVGERVTVGQEISNRCEDSLTEMGKQLLQIGQSIREIVTANKEQESGVKQANLAIAEVDKSTQQNAQNAQSLSENAKLLQSESDLLLKDIQRLQSLVFGA